MHWLRLSAPVHDRGLAMCTVARRDLLLRRRPKEVETDSVTGDSGQESAFGWWTIHFVCFLGLYAGGSIVFHVGFHMGLTLPTAFSFNSQMCPPPSRTDTCPQQAIKLKAGSAVQKV